MLQPHEHDRNALSSPSSLQFYADDLELAGDMMHRDYRYVSQILFQVDELIHLPPNPTGSRLYGTYATHESDWDWFFDAVTGVRIMELSRILQNHGWHESPNREGSLYKGNVNVILLAGQVFRDFALATTECVRLNPITKEEAVDVFRDIMETDAPYSGEHPRDDYYEESEI